ncbi:hypothetical protein BC833DRAFT_609722 [Globomyces pollinis-pini]|nr:hypothetical protein BC833DRAFT_609722 [Globomyces pollinis-pini]
MVWATLDYIIHTGTLNVVDLQKITAFAPLLTHLILYFKDGDSQAVSQLQEILKYLLNRAKSCFYKVNER